MIDGNKPFMLRSWEDWVGMDRRSFDIVSVWVKLPHLHPWFRSAHMLGKIGRTIVLDYVEASHSLVGFDGFKQTQLELTKFAKC